MHIRVMRLSASHVTLAIFSGDRFWGAERGGQGEVGGCTRRVQTAWSCLGVAVNSPLLHGARWAISWVLSVLWAKKTVLSPCIAANSSDLSARVSYHCPCILIAYSLTSGVVRVTNVESMAVCRNFSSSDRAKYQTTPQFGRS